MKIQRRSLVRGVASGISLLSPREKLLGAIITVGMTASALLSVLSLLAVLPVINLVIQPESVAESRYLNAIHFYLGSPPFQSFVTMLGIGVAMVMTFSAAFDWLMTYLLNRFGSRCQDRLADEIIRRCLYAPYSWYMNQSTPALKRLLFDDVSMWSRQFIQKLITMFKNTSVALVSIAAVLLLSSLEGFIALGVTGALAYALFAVVRPRLEALSARKRIVVDRTSVTLTQALLGAKEIKISSRQEYFARRFMTAYSELSNTQAKLIVWNQSPQLFLTSVGQIGLLGVVLVLWSLGKNGAEIATQLAVFYLVPGRIVPALNMVSQSVGALIKTFPFNDGLHEILASSVGDSRRDRETVDTSKPVIGDWETLALSSVSFKYAENGPWVLRDVDLLITRGHSYGIVGQSAAGKSTLLDLLVGLLSPTEGRICIDGQSLNSFQLRSWQERIGYVAQSPFMLDDTLRANVAFGEARKRVDDQRVLECLRLANLGSLSEELVEGLDALLGEQGTRLSGGQQQRLAIARALYRAPELLVFDEATSALDSISESEVLAALDNLRGRTTSVVVAHRLTTIRNCDRIFLLDKGRLLGEGSYEDLLADQPLFRQMATGVLATA